MGIRLIAGRAGSGKTEQCQREIRRELEHNLVDGPRLVMLVPEQACLQMERSLLAESSSQTLGRCEVLSFKRLANRIFNESQGQPPVTLSLLGRQMAVRFLLGRHRDALREFGNVADRSGFVRELSLGLAELIQEAVVPSQLDDAAASAASADEPSAARLHDTALLYRAYLEHLGEQRVDPEGVLDMARDRLKSATWLRDARFWFDGFAGFTMQQTRMIVAMAGLSSELTLSFLMDTHRTELEDADELSLFARTEQTLGMVRRALLAAGHTIDETLRLDPERGLRFKSTELDTLEKRLFKAAAQPESDEEQIEDHDPNSPAEPVRLFMAPNRRVEVDAAVRTIADLVRRPEEPMRYRDIAIVVRDLAEYHDLISASLQRHAIPFFIDRRRPTYHHGLVRTVRAALSLIGSRRFDTAMAQLLKSGMSGLADHRADAAQTYCVNHGIRSPDAWEITWSHPSRKRRRRETEAADTVVSSAEKARADLRARLGTWWPDPRKPGGPAQSGRDWARELVELLDRLEVTDALARWCRDAENTGNADQRMEHEQVWIDLMRVLDEVADALGDEQMNAVQFREVMETALSDFTVGLVPATLDQVLVSSIERSRHPPIKAVFLLGFVDGEFPRQVPEDTIFGEAERARLCEAHPNLGRTRKQRLLDERMLAYIGVTRASDLLWVSYPGSAEDGSPTQPSPFWPFIRGALPDVPVRRILPDAPASLGAPIDLANGVATRLRSWGQEQLRATEAEPWLALYEWARMSPDPRVRGALIRVASAFEVKKPATLHAAAARTLWGTTHTTSVSKLETYASCPFKHFVTYGLRLDEKARRGFTPLEWGNLYHQILDTFYAELIKAKRKLSDLSHEDIKVKIVEVCERVLPEIVDDKYFTTEEQEAIKWRCSLELPPAVFAQRISIGQTALEPQMTEAVFGDEQSGMDALELIACNDRTVAVRGKIDRIDRMDASDNALFAVFDYKRTLPKSGLPLDRVYHGLAFQLLSYLIVARDHYASDKKSQPAGAFYLPLRADYETLDHPDEADAEKFDPYAEYRPRGIIDVEAAGVLDPGSKKTGGSVFNVMKKKDGDIGRFETSDAVRPGELPLLLSHTQAKITETATQLLEGRIAVEPTKLRRTLPCTYCEYRGVCRFEYAAAETRQVESMSRSEVLAALQQANEGATDA